MSEQEAQALAVKAAINALLPAGVLAYDADEVPGTTGGPSGTVPTRYVTVEIYRRRNFYLRGGADMVHLGAVTTHYRAPNVTTARALRDNVRAALEDHTLDLADGGTVGPFGFDVDGGISFVADGWSGFDTWRF